MGLRDLDRKDTATPAPGTAVQPSRKEVKDRIKAIAWDDAKGQARLAEAGLDKATSKIVKTIQY